MTVHGSGQGCGAVKKSCFIVQTQTEDIICKDCEVTFQVSCIAILSPFLYKQASTLLSGYSLTSVSTNIAANSVMVTASSCPPATSTPP